MWIFLLSFLASVKLASHARQNPLLFTVFPFVGRYNAPYKQKLMSENALKTQKRQPFPKKKLPW